MRKLPDDELKIANIKPFGLRLQPGLKDTVETAAKNNNRSINAEIVARLERTFIEDAERKALPHASDRIETLSSEIEIFRKQMRGLEVRLHELEVKK